MSKVGYGFDFGSRDPWIWAESAVRIDPDNIAEERNYKLRRVQQGCLAKAQSIGRPVIAHQLDFGPDAGRALVHVAPDGGLEITGEGSSAVYSVLKLLSPRPWDTDITDIRYKELIKH